jgi:hypothetical protein
MVQTMAFFIAFSRPFFAERRKSAITSSSNNQNLCFAESLLTSRTDRQRQVSQLSQ